MNDPVLPIGQCDVRDKASLVSYRTKKATWSRWLKTDDHHAVWPQIYSMLIGDLTFKTLAAAAEADELSALHSPIIMRGLVLGYAATQGLAIRRLVDPTKRVISLRKLLDDIRNPIGLFSRENYVSGENLPYDTDAAMQKSLAGAGTTGFWAPGKGKMAFVHSMQAHAAFDRLAGKLPASRNRADRIPKRLIDTIESWLKAEEINEVVEWSNMRIAHAADLESYQNVNLAALAPTMDKISTAQRQIVRATEAVSAYLLRGPVHGDVVPVFQYSQFSRFEMAVPDP